ncbi:MAG: hypothetical protein WC641_07405 [Patescibacteria group bacterium]
MGREACWTIVLSLFFGAGCTLNTKGTAEAENDAAWDAHVPPIDVSVSPEGAPDSAEEEVSDGGLEPSEDHFEPLESESSVEAPDDVATDDGDASAEDAAVDPVDATIEDADAPIEDADAAIDSVDAPDDVFDASVDTIDVVEEPVPTGLCGPIPQAGWWICYAWPHPDAAAWNVGLAGAVVPFGGDIVYLWADPFKGVAGNCIAPLASDDFVLCDLGLLVSKIEVSIAPGLHPNINASTQSYACWDTCLGSAEIYHNGGLVGWLVQGATGGILTYVQHYQPPLRKDLFLKVP